MNLHKFCRTLLVFCPVLGTRSPAATLRPCDALGREDVCPQASMGLPKQQDRESSSRSTRRSARLSSDGIKGVENPAVAHTKSQRVNTVTDVGAQLAEIAGKVRRTSPFVRNEGVTELCAFRPPYGFRDSAQR
eukprot:702901-Pleurochrysis_carterae.AAC.2